MKRIAHAQRSRRVYWPNCAVCQYMKKHPQFREQIMASTYFNSLGSKNMLQVVHDWGDPFKPSAMYQHIKRHQARDLIKVDKLEEARVIPPVVEAVESSVTSATEHERGLDEFIRDGRNKLSRGELSMTASSYLQAIKIKSDIEKNTKDRRMEMIKQFFGGPNGNNNGKPGQQTPASS